MCPLSWAVPLHSFCSALSSLTVVSAIISIFLQLLFSWQSKQQNRWKWTLLLTIQIASHPKDSFQWRLPSSALCPPFFWLKLINFIKWNLSIILQILDIGFVSLYLKFFRTKCFCCCCCCFSLGLLLLWCYRSLVAFSIFTPKSIFQIVKIILFAFSFKVEFIPFT